MKIGQASTGNKVSGERENGNWGGKELCVCVCVECFIVYIYYVLTCYTIDEDCIWRDNHNAHLFATFLLRLGDSDGKESIFNAGNLDLIPQSERSPGKGNCYQLQYSCLEHPMKRGACQAIVRGVAKSKAWLSDQHFHFQD